MNTIVPIFEPQTRSFASQIPIKLSTGRGRKERQGLWKTKASNFAQFAEGLQSHQEGKKDGPCFLQGECAGGSRKAMAMIANYVIGVDLDAGKPMSEVIEAIVDAGLEAVVYTTHSHLKDTSQIKRDHFLKWNDGEDPCEDSVRDYLMVKKGLIPEVVRNIEIVDDAHHTEEGVVIVVKHDPIPKFRAVFPLEEPFIFAKRGGAQKDAIAEWKERYAGFCTKLGFFYDETCADPARLFYLPRHPKGAVHDSRWIVGNPVNLDDYDRVKVRRDRRTRQDVGPSNVFTEMAGSIPDDDERDRYVIDGFNLLAWAKENAKLFECEAFLTQLCPDMLREPRTGGPGVHVECPFEAEHSNFGGGGTFVVNAGDNWNEGFESGFTFKCVHDSCSHRDRLNMIMGCIEEGWFMVEDLNKTTHKMEVEEEEGDERPTPAKITKTPVYEQASDDSDLDEETRNLNYFNSKYAIVETSGGVRIVREYEDGEIAFYTQSDVALREKSRAVFLTDNKGKTTRYDGFKLWLEHPDRRVYDRVLFDPNCNEPRVYNLFRGFPIEPKPGDWSLLRSHVFENICESNDEYFEWFMTWCAQLIQKPATKPGSAIVVAGKKGSGKSTVFDYLGELMPLHHNTVSKSSQITGKFNGHIQTSLLMQCEEAFWAGDPHAEGVLKDLITGKYAMIERKGLDAFKAVSCVRLVMISNNDWVVPANGPDERRFAVFKCSDARLQDLDFWSAVRKQMDEEEGLQAMMYELANYKPKNGWACLFKPPRTSGLEDQTYQSLSEVEKLLFELLQTGGLEMEEFGKDTIELSPDRATEIYATDLRAALRDHLKQSSNRSVHALNFPSLERLVERWLGASVEKISLPGKANKRTRYVVPPLPDARAHAERRCGVSFRD